MKKKLFLSFILGLFLFACSDKNEDDIMVPGPGKEPVKVETVSLYKTDGINFTYEGQSIEFEFLVDPKNDSLNTDINSEDCQIFLIDEDNKEIGKDEEGNVSITEISLRFQNSSSINGRYVMTLKNLCKSNSGFNIKTRILIRTSYGDITSPEFVISYETELGKILATGLPVVIINTPKGNEINSKEEWTPEVSMIIYDSNGDVDYEGSLSMKGRGNTTWWLYPKKPYALKLDSKSKILGMKKHKRWCLLANYIDRTLIRNDVAFEISRKTDLPYTPSGQFVELIFNGKYQGNYYLTEQIKVDENRVNIAELKDVVEGEGITGGYIFELDTYYDETYKFYSDKFGLPWQFKDPDEVNGNQFEYVRNYVKEMETTLMENNVLSHDYLQYIDIESFIDYWFVYELTTNWEPNHPKSVYMTKDMNGKIMAGPVWDFDWETFNSTWTSKFVIKDAIYYKTLFKDPKFVETLKERWILLKPRFDTIPTYIEGLREKIRKSNDLNYEKWKCPEAVNADYKLNYDESIDMLKKAYVDKLNWLDQSIQNL